MKETSNYLSTALPGTILLANLDFSNLLPATIQSAIGTAFFLIGKLVYDRFQRIRQQKADELKEQKKAIRKNKK